MLVVGLCACNNPASLTENQDKPEEATFSLSELASDYYLEDTVRIGIAAYPDTFLPYLADNIPEQEPLVLIYDQLFSYGLDFKLEGKLVKSYTISEDGLHYSFELKDDIFFHDGSKLTADDVIFTINLIRDRANASPLNDKFQYIESISKQDDLMFSLTLKQAYARFLNALTIYIMPQTAFLKDPLALANQPIGTGAYQFKQGDGQKSFILEVNDNYWQPIANIDYLEFCVISEATDRLIAIDNKELDLIIGGLLAADVDRLTENVDNSNVVIEQSISTTYEYLGFMLNHTPLDDVRVRQAIAYALDKDLLTAEMQGYRSMVSLPHGHWATNDLDINSYDIDLQFASELLEEAELSLPCVITLSCTANRLELAELIKEQLAEIKIIIDIVVLEPEEFVQEMCLQNMMIYLHGWAEQYDPDQSTIFVSTEIPDSGANRNGYTNLKIDDIYKEARMTADVSLRRDMYQQAWQIMIGDEASFIPIYTPRHLVAYNGLLSGLVVAPYPIGTLRSLAIAKMTAIE